MKTAMQEHIEWLKEELQRCYDESRSVSYINVFREKILLSSIEHAESLLEKEKALLIKTHGNKKVYDHQIDPTIVTGEQWYNETYGDKK